MNKFDRVIITMIICDGVCILAESFCTVHCPGLNVSVALPGGVTNILTVTW